MAPVSLELRERIVVWRYELNMSIDNIAQLFGRSKRTVNYVLETYRNYGQLVNPFVQLNFIDSVLAAEPSLHLDEVQEKFHIFRDIEVSISTISRTLSQMDHTYKGIAKEALE